MTELPALWLPILLSAVIVLVASSVIHMATPWHKSDYLNVPNEDRVRDAIRTLGIPPGDYMIPRPDSAADMRSPEFADKIRQGPKLVMTVFRPGDMSMTKPLALWFVYAIVVGVSAAYVTGRALAPGAGYLEVFRFAGTTAFIAYAAALWQMSIWYQRSWLTTFKATVDGLIYGLLTAGAFGWLWPR